MGDVEDELVIEICDELEGTLFVIARGPLGAASVLVAISTRCCSLSAYMPEFALIVVSLILSTGGLGGGAESTSIAFRPLAIDRWGENTGSTLRCLMMILPDGPNGGRRELFRDSTWLVSREETFCCAFCCG